MAHGGFLGLIYLFMIGFFALIFTSDPHAPKAVLGFITAFIAVISAVFVAPQIIGGWKMYKEQPNAKTWGIVGSIIACMNAPLGTAAGVFALIFLFGDEGSKFYSEVANPKYIGAPNYTEEFQFNNYREKQPPDWR